MYKILKQKKSRTNFGENKPIARELKLKSHENLMNHMSQSGTGYFCRTSTVPYIKEAHEYNSKPTYDNNPHKTILYIIDYQQTKNFTYVIVPAVIFY